MNHHRTATQEALLNARLRPRPGHASAWLWAAVVWVAAAILTAAVWMAATGRV